MQIFKKLLQGTYIPRILRRKEIKPHFQSLLKAGGLSENVQIEQLSKEIYGDGSAEGVAKRLVLNAIKKEMA